MFGGNGVNFAEREGPVKCTVILIEPYMVDPDAEETSTVACMLHPEYEGDSISGITYKLYTPSFPHNFFEDVEYATTDLTISAALIKTAGGRGKHGGGVIFMKNGATATKEWRGKGKGKGNNNGGGLRSSSIAENSGMMFANRTTGRRLAQTTGNSTLIVLYAVPLDASNIDRTPTQLANDVFGIAVNETQDLVNARSQVLSCSGGKLSYIPACGTPEQSCSSNVNQSIWFKNGVLQVPIPYNVTGIASAMVKNWWKRSSENPPSPNPKNRPLQLHSDYERHPRRSRLGRSGGVGLPPRSDVRLQKFLFVCYGCHSSRVRAYIGLHHSGFGTAAYADHSCLLGNPSYGDDGPAICFNGAKSWETGWYATDSVDVVPSSTVLFTADSSALLTGPRNLHSRKPQGQCFRITDSTVTQKHHIMYNRAKAQWVTFARIRSLSRWASAGVVHQAALDRSTSQVMYPVFRKESSTVVTKLCSTTAGNATAPDTANVMVYLDDGVAFNNGFMCPNEVPCINDSGCNDNNFCTQNTQVNNTCMPPVDISPLSAQVAVI
ncbi:hypothetical protein ACHAW5_005041 [Stephanodiscus triporus]|uniref:Uncharacterized protein n=1 Tax=Stephanodiscus triporus TaxID=2934178 RepID=A0ABD3QM44_9STRA